MDGEQSTVDSAESVKVSDGRPVIVCVSHHHADQCSGPPMCCSNLIECVKEGEPNHYFCRHRARGRNVDELTSEIRYLVKCLGRLRPSDATEISHFHSQDPCPEGGSPCDQPSRIACYHLPGAPGSYCVHSISLPFRDEDEHIIHSIAKSVFG